MTNKEHLDWDHGGVKVDLLRKEATELHQTLRYHLNIVNNNTEVVKQYVSK